MEKDTRTCDSYEYFEKDVRHGRWVRNPNNGYFECSECKTVKPYDGIDLEDPEQVTYWVCNYCPCCGSRMN